MATLSVKVYDVNAGKAYGVVTDLNSVETGEAFLFPETDPLSVLFSRVDQLVNQWEGPVAKPWQTCTLAQHPELLKRSSARFSDCSLWDTRAPAGEFQIVLSPSSPIRNEDGDELQIQVWQETEPMVMWNERALQQVSTPAKIAVPFEPRRSVNEELQLLVERKTVFFRV